MTSSRSTCAAVEPLLAARMFATLSAADRRDLEAHLAACAGCRFLAADLDRSAVGRALVAEGMVDAPRPRYRLTATLLFIAAAVLAVLHFSH